MELSRSAYAHEHCGSAAGSGVRWPLAASPGRPRAQDGREFRPAEAGQGHVQVQADSQDFL